MDTDAVPHGKLHLMSVEHLHRGSFQVIAAIARLGSFVSLRQACMNLRAGVV
ncbi:MAG: hypothetical protein ACLQOO_09830 [Terriglobia bacterium]